MLGMNTQRYYRESLENALDKIGIAGQELVDIREAVITRLATLKGFPHPHIPPRLPDNFFDIARSARIIARQNSISPDQVIAELGKHIDALFEIHDLRPIEKKSAKIIKAELVRKPDRNHNIIAAVTLPAGKRKAHLRDDDIPRAASETKCETENLPHSTTPGKSVKKYASDKKRRTHGPVLSKQQKPVTAKASPIKKKSIVPLDTAAQKEIVRHMIAENWGVKVEDLATMIPIPERAEVKIDPNIRSLISETWKKTNEDPATIIPSHKTVETNMHTEEKAPDPRPIALPSAFSVQAEYVFLDCARLIKQNGNLPTDPNFDNFIGGKSVPDLNEDFKAGAVSGWERFMPEKPTCLQSFLLSVGMAEKSKDGQVRAAPARHIRAIERAHGL